MNLQKKLLIKVEPLYQQLSQKWSVLPANDQKALSILTIFAILIIFYFGIISPINTLSKKGIEEYKSQAELHRWLQSKAPLLKKGKSGSISGRDMTVPLVSLVPRLAKQANITLQRFEPQGDKLRVQLDNAVFNDTTKWLQKLERQYSINIASISIESQKEAGLVDINLALVR